MKRAFNSLCILTVAALMAGFAGCANTTGNSQPCPTTQPEPLCTQPAEQPVCVAAEAPPCVEVVEVEEVICEAAEPVCGENRHSMTKPFERLVHNAELADMSLADVHFLPHRPGLNSTGTQRLNHLAWLVDQYGGAIKLDLEEPKGELTDGRVAMVKAYLECWGLPAEKIKVEVGLPDQEGMNAKEAITIYEDTRYKKCEK